MIKHFSVLFLIFFSVRSREENSYEMLQNFVINCANRTEILNCVKIQALKVLNRALTLKNIKLFEGVSFVRDDSQPRNAHYGLRLDDKKLKNLDSEQLDDLLDETSSEFLRNHHVEIRVPKSEKESRRKKKTKGGGGGTALYWALAIKGTLLVMAYNGIAVMSGMALMMGKMALLLTAILGLKFLATKPEKTTVEIVKKPKYTESHVYSNSYEDEMDHNYQDRADRISKILRRYY